MREKIVLLDAIANILNEKVTIAGTVSGGCIAQSYRLKTASGTEYFVKTDYRNPAMFAAEAHGLRELAKQGSIAIPKVIAVSEAFLLLEYVTTGIKPKQFFETLGTQLAHMHKTTNEQFGFYEDNFIGSTPQMNIAQETEATHWAEFYLNKRLLFQYHLAEKNGYTDITTLQLFKKLETILPSLLADGENIASLLHGDLWSGNVMWNNNGEPVLIDPACFYGNRETDLAMTRLFGGFPAVFYDAYESIWALPKHWQKRVPAYQLYHVLNHLNLFGQGYLGEAIGLMRACV